MAFSQPQKTINHTKPWQRFLSGISPEFKEAVAATSMNVAKGGVVILNSAAIGALLVTAEGYPLQAKALVGSLAFSAIMIGMAKIALDRFDHP